MYLLRINFFYNNNFQIYFLSHLFVYFDPIRLFYCNKQYNSTIHWVLLGKADSMKQPVRKSKVFFALCDSPFECSCSPNNALKSARSFCWFCLSKEKSESMNRAITPHTHTNTPLPLAFTDAESWGGVRSFLYRVQIRWDTQPSASSKSPITYWLVFLPL